MTISKHMLLISMLTLSISVVAEPGTLARAQFDWLKQLNGDWVLAPADRQEGKATQHKLVAPLIGTESVAISYKVIGKGSTVQENLLPGTGKEMATMYHCNDVSCSQVEAKHYCVKQNQPELIAEPSSNPGTLVLNCDMSTDLCQSKQNHIHQITQELSADGNHLKVTYTSYAEGKYLKDSVYHFDRKQ
jgi:hypothetical protein